MSQSVAVASHVNNLAVVYEAVEDILPLTGVNEELKAQDPMQWVGLMNNLKSCAREIMSEE